MIFFLNLLIEDGRKNLMESFFNFPLGIYTLTN